MKHVASSFPVWFVVLLLTHSGAVGGEHPNPYPTAFTLQGTRLDSKFPENAAEWRAVRDCQLVNREGYSTVVTSGTDSILVKSVTPCEFQLVVIVECRTDTATTSQLFWDASGRDSFFENASHRFDLLGDSQWHRYEVYVPVKGVTSFRLDPRDSIGDVDLRVISIQPVDPPALEIAVVKWLGPDRLQLLLENSSEQSLSSELRVSVAQAPEVLAPEVLAPEVLAPEVLAPEAQAPETQSPETQSSETQSPETQSPETQSPEIVSTTPVALQAKQSKLIDITVPLSQASADLVDIQLTAGKSQARRPSVRINIPLDRPDWTQLIQHWPQLVDTHHGLWVDPQGLSAVIGMRSSETDDWQVAATMAPLCWNRKALESFQVSKIGEAILLRSASTQLQFNWVAGELSIQRQTTATSAELLSKEGPVIRIPGEIEQGLLPGVEYLGRHEASSSTIDIQTENHLRFEPAPHQLTCQMAAIITQPTAISVGWSDVQLRPSFATPNFYDGYGESRISWLGTRVDARLSLSAGWLAGTRLEDCIRDFVMRRGLPQSAVAPRSAAEQDALNISGLLHSDLFQADQGWYHAILAENPTLNIPKSPRWFGDHAAALIALDQPLPTTADKIVRGGSHISNDRWMFLNGRAGEWANSQDAKVQSLIAQQQTDGSVLYDGKWSEGHFEKTSSGQCGILANQLLQIAWWTGNRKALQAGLVTLDYCQRFRTPRGAQVWECPLHAPDLMAAAHLAQAYSLAFRLTGQPKYQDQAVRWATSGIPFIYLWGDSWMPYSSIATLCATHRVAPLWIGRPVQWCGIVYANALLDLHEIDQSLPWKQLAEGIYRSATIQQYTQGRAIGLLPDSIFPTSNRRFPLDINPATIVLLGKRLEQKAVELQCAVIDGQHVVSPWPILSSPEEVRFDCGSPNDFEIAINGQVRSVRFDSRLTRPLK